MRRSSNIDLHKKHDWSMTSMKNEKKKSKIPKVSMANETKYFWRSYSSENSEKSALWKKKNLQKKESFFYKLYNLCIIFIVFAENCLIKG